MRIPLEICYREIGKLKEKFKELKKENESIKQELKQVKDKLDTLTSNALIPVLSATCRHNVTKNVIFCI